MEFIIFGISNLIWTGIIGGIIWTKCQRNEKDIEKIDNEIRADLGEIRNDIKELVRLVGEIGGHKDA